MEQHYHKHRTYSQGMREATRKMGVREADAQRLSLGHANLPSLKMKNQKRGSESSHRSRKKTGVQTLDLGVY